MEVKGSSSYSPVKGKKRMGESFFECCERSLLHNKITFFENTVTEPMDVYKILGQNYKEERKSGKAKYRKLISQKMTLYKRKKIAIASQMLINCGKYNKGKLPEPGQHQYFFKEDIFYYATTCNFPKLIKALQQYPDLINQTDEQGSSLLYLACQPGFYALSRYLLLKGCNPNIQNKSFGSTALHVAAYYGHKEIVELLLLNGADYKIKNKCNNEPIKETNDEKIKFILQKHEKLFEQDQIMKELKEMRDNDVLTLCHQVYTPEQQNIGIFGSIKYSNQEQEKLKNYLKNKENYQRAYHGTNIKSAVSIIKNGFIRPSKRDGVRSCHIPLDVSHDGIDNWADAIFVSQSIYMACHTTYSDCVNIQAPIKNETFEDLENIKDEEYRFIFQIAVKNNSYTEHEHTVGYYDFQEDEPEMLEWRVEEEESIVILGFYFIRQQILTDLASHANLKKFSDEESRMSGIMSTEDNTLGQQVQFQKLCFMGHQMSDKIKQSFDCDVCDETVLKHYHCQKCDFTRCLQCVQNNILI